MKKYNFLPGAPTPQGGSATPPERLSPQAKRLATIGGIGVLLLGAAYLYTTYFQEVTPPPPSPRTARRASPTTSPPKPITPPMAKPEAQRPQVATKVPEPKQRRGEALRKARSPRTEAPPKQLRPAEGPRERPQPNESPPKRVNLAEAVQERPKGTETVPGAEKPPTQIRTQKPSSPKLQTNPVQGRGQFTVQVASLVINQNALALKKQLEELGYTPVVHMTTAPISQHRVYVGDFSSHEETERMARRLNVDGFPSNLVHGGDGKFRLQVGSYYNLNRAIDLAHTLQEKKYTPKIDSKAVPTPVHQVRVGEYESRAEALKALEGLKKQGFAPIIVKR